MRLCLLILVGLVFITSGCKKKTEIENEFESETDQLPNLIEPPELQNISTGYLYKSTTCFVGANNSSFRRYFTKLIRDNTIVLRIEDDVFTGTQCETGSPPLTVSWMAEYRYISSTLNTVTDQYSLVTSQIDLGYTIFSAEKVNEWNLMNSFTNNGLWEVSVYKSVAGTSSGPVTIPTNGTIISQNLSLQVGLFTFGGIQFE